MKVEYDLIEIKTSVIDGHYFTSQVSVKRTGEIAGVIYDSYDELDKFIIADDETKSFVKIPINKCTKIE